MIDPIGAFEEIRENFILYIKTAFGTRFPTLEADRANLLQQNRVLNQEPWIEPLPRYQSSSKTIATLSGGDLPGMSAAQIEIFKNLVQLGLFDNRNPLYLHQARMLKSALNGKNCVVTAGSGRVKQNHFCSRYSQLARNFIMECAWRNTPHWNGWWSNAGWQAQCRSSTNIIQRSYRISQRDHETRPPRKSIDNLSNECSCGRPIDTVTQVSGFRCCSPVV